MSDFYFRPMIIFLLLTVFNAISASGGEITLEYDFERPLLEETMIAGVLYQRINMPGASNSGQPGHPALPATGAAILIPMGAEVENIEVMAEGTIYLGRDILIEPVGQPFPLSAAPAAITPPEPDPAVYSLNRFFPAVPYHEVGIHKFRGYRILIVRLQPMQYLPAEGELYYHPRLKAVVTTTDTRQTEPMLRALTVDAAELTDRVDNPDIAATYPVATSRAGDISLLILTTPELAEAFQSLKDYHDAHGRATAIHTTADIGGNDPDLVRDYIRERYLNDGLEYLLIGGDDDLIPAKDLYVTASGAIAYDMPADIYFGCLDGTYNSDGDSLWGESNDGEAGDVDLMAEVYVGRASVDNVGEANRFVIKTLDYLNSHAPYLQEVLLCGEHLGFGGISEYAAYCMDQIADFSAADEYITYGIPSSLYNIDRLYDMNWLNWDWPESEILDRVAEGKHIINHLGHGNTYWALKMYATTAANSMINSDRFFLYSQACYAGKFDNAEGWAEHVNVKTDHGAFAVIMNARYGYGASNSTDGPSQRFNREFWDAIFDSEESKPQLSRANQDSKEDNLYRIDEPCMRWCYYQLNLFGDPTIILKTEWINLLFHQFSEFDGDADGNLEPGETIRLVLSIKNVGATAMVDANLTLSCDDPNINITSGSVALGDIAPGGTASNNDTPFLFDLPIDYEARIDSFFVQVSWNGGSQSQIIALEKAMGGISLLLVDDDLGQRREDYYTEYLDYKRIPYDIWNCYSSGSPWVNSMLDYELVIWFTGDYTPYPFSANDITSIKGYLDGGGKLFLTGQYTAAQLDNYNPDFLHGYLKADYLLTEWCPVVGAIAGGQVFNPADSVLIHGSGGASNQSHTDHISPLGGAVAEMQYLNLDGYGAITYTGDYQLLYFAFGFEAIVNGQSRWLDRDSVMVKIFDFFDIQRPTGVPSVYNMAVGPGQPMNLVDHTPLLSWTYADSVIGPQQKCQIQISTDQYWLFPDIWDSGPLDWTDSSIEYFGSELADGQTYNIRLRAGNGLFWSDWNYTTMRMNSRPVAAVDLQPCDLDIVCESCPLLQHRNAIDGENDELTYTYEIYDDPQLSTLLLRVEDQPEDIYSSSWTVTLALDDEHDYFWRVLAEDPYEGNSAWSEAAAFWVNSVNYPPESFELLEPDSDVMFSPPDFTFNWTEAIDSDAFDLVTYTLYISADPAFSSSIVKAETEQTEITVTGQFSSDYIYYWRVKAEDKYGGEFFCPEVRSFRVHLRGDTNDDDDINVGDAVFLINFVFKNGPPPTEYEAGDTNCDSKVNVGDAVFLINYIFKSGPIPACN